MPEEFKAGCQRPKAKQKVATEDPAAATPTQKEAASTMIKVGQPAPDFTLPAYIKGKFANVNLAEYKGKWVVLCFYPGDFTFV